MTIHTYLSPHLDDAALSCGGRIANQVAAGERVRVINIFAGIPDYTHLSPYAKKQHAGWGNQPDPIGTRRAEDRRVLEGLGAEIRNWDYYDCIYREADGEFLYTNHAAVFGSINPAENFRIKHLDEQLSQVRQQNFDAVFYAPLRVGGHVDHTIVRERAIVLHRRGAIVLFYEDFPYVAKLDWKDEPTTVEKALAELPFDWTSELEPINAEAKIATVMGYESQMKNLFDGTAGLDDMLRTYAAGLSPAKGFFERYWRIR